ncbi:uncharacterized protein LOC134802411 isoform X2 [Cydia splendana]|uniref:uncharacterized protein LOC134802411 isoform X2 n=1 Tax=Cydia splendana TaxID=1100963 RepID=UPI00300CBEB1
MYLRTSLLLATCLCIMATHQCFSNSTGTNPGSDPEDPRELLYRELSPEAYFSLPCHDPGDTAQTFRRQYSEKDLSENNWLKKDDIEFNKLHRPPAHAGSGALAEEDVYNDMKHENKLPSHFNPQAYTIFHLCYAMSYIWRRGRKGIHRYYNLRDRYINHLPFEIGYITQTIMAKYQNVLELYEFATRMESEKKVGRSHLFFFYKNILEDCRTIIHLCNMLHEVTRKYRTVQYSYRGEQWLPVKYDPGAKMMDPAGFEYMQPVSVKDYTLWDHRPTREREFGVEGFEHDKILHEGVGNIEKNAWTTDGNQQK